MTTWSLRNCVASLSNNVSRFDISWVHWTVQSFDIGFLVEVVGVRESHWKWVQNRLDHRDAVSFCNNAWRFNSAKLATRQKISGCTTPDTWFSRWAAGTFSGHFLYKIIQRPKRQTNSSLIFYWNGLKSFSLNIKIWLWNLANFNFFVFGDESRRSLTRMFNVIFMGEKSFQLDSVIYK